jgi:hypothetical protein
MQRAETKLHALWNLAVRGTRLAPIDYYVRNGDVLRQAGKKTSKLFALDQLEWWRHDEAQGITVAVLKTDRKLIVKDSSGRLANLLLREFGKNASND